MEVQYHKTPSFKIDLHKRLHGLKWRLRELPYIPHFITLSDVSKHILPQAQRKGHRPQRLTRPQGTRAADTEGQQADFSKMPQSPREAREAPGRPAEQQGLPGSRGVRGTGGQRHGYPPPKLSDSTPAANLPFPPRPTHGVTGAAASGLGGGGRQGWHLPEETHCQHHHRRISNTQAENNPAVASHLSPSFCIRTVL